MSLTLAIQATQLKMAKLLYKAYLYPSQKKKEEEETT